MTKCNLAIYSFFTDWINCNLCFSLQINLPVVFSIIGCQKNNPDSQNPTSSSIMFFIYCHIWRRKAANPHIWEAGTSKLLSFLLHKWLKRLISYQNSCQTNQLIVSALYGLWSIFFPGEHRAHLPFKRRRPAKHRDRNKLPPTFFLESSDFLETFFSFLCRWFKTCNNKKGL